MRKCPKCKIAYTDDNNFCCFDGTELVDEEMEHLNDDSHFVYEIIESRAY